MKIISGLFDHIVLQRAQRNRSATVVTGETNATGSVVARVGRRQFTAPIRQSRFALKLAGLPAGGPYTVVLTAGAEKLVVKDVLVGDVWICAGQSNMEGLGWLRSAAKPVKQVRAFYMDDRWAVARDPIHNLSECVDEVHVIINGGVRPVRDAHVGVGPAVDFAQAMWRRTGVPQGLLACAHGGTSMEQWSPAQKSAGTKSLYGATLRRVAKNGGQIAGMIWYQGESDASEAAAAVYTRKMREFIRALRRDLRAPRLPVALVQISRYVVAGDATYWNSIQNQQRLLPKVIPQLAVVPSIDLPMDDIIHIGGTGNARLGRRLAEAMHALRGGDGARPSLAVKSIRVVTNEASKLGDIIIGFGNVTGRLVSGGRPHGFDLDRPFTIFDISLTGHKAVLRTTLPAALLRPMKLSYGAGTDPYCNIADAADRAVPAFGPLDIGAPWAVTAWLKPRVSEVFPGAGKLAGLSLPADLVWRAKPFPGDFCDVHSEFVSAGSGDKLIYYVCVLTLCEPMKLVALLGYDGPVKLWVDGRELFHDPNGTNPAVQDARPIRFDGAAGQHQLVVALGSNNSRAWGVFLRIQRWDISRKQLRLGPTAYVMPEIS